MELNSAAPAFRPIGIASQSAGTNSQTPVHDTAEYWVQNTGEVCWAADSYTLLDEQETNDGDRTPGRSLHFSSETPRPFVYQAVQTPVPKYASDQHSNDQRHSAPSASYDQSNAYSQSGVFDRDQLVFYADPYSQIATFGEPRVYTQPEACAPPQMYAQPEELAQAAEPNLEYNEYFAPFQNPENKLSLATRVSNAALSAEAKPWPAPHYQFNAPASQQRQSETQSAQLETLDIASLKTSSIYRTFDEGNSNGRNSGWDASNGALADTSASLSAFSIEENVTQSSEDMFDENFTRLSNVGVSDLGPPMYNMDDTSRVSVNTVDSEMSLLTPNSRESLFNHTQIYQESSFHYSPEFEETHRSPQQPSQNYQPASHQPSQIYQLASRQSSQNYQPASYPLSQNSQMMPQHSPQSYQSILHRPHDNNLSVAHHYAADYQGVSHHTPGSYQAVSHHSFGSYPSVSQYTPSNYQEVSHTSIESSQRTLHNSQNYHRALPRHFQTNQRISQNSFQTYQRSPTTPFQSNQASRNSLNDYRSMQNHQKASHIPFMSFHQGIDSSQDNNGVSNHLSQNLQRVYSDGYQGQHSSFSSAFPCQGAPLRESASYLMQQSPVFLPDYESSTNLPQLGDPNFYASDLINSNISAPFGAYGPAPTEPHVHYHNVPTFRTEIAEAVLDQAAHAKKNGGRKKRSNHVRGSSFDRLLDPIFQKAMEEFDGKYWLALV